VALEVVGVERLLQPGEVERLELPRAPDRGRGVPAQPRVHHQLEVLAQALAGGPDVGEVALLALPHRPPTELHGPEGGCCSAALRNGLAGQLAGDALSLRGRVAEQDGGVSAERLAEAAAEELVDRPPGRLAGDVPQGDFDA